MTATRYLQQLALLTLSMALGAGLVARFHQSDEAEAYERGYADGLEECKKPSRLEKAAEWLAE